MKITAIRLDRMRLPLDPPFNAAWDPVPRTWFDATLVTVETDEGVTGYGSGDTMDGFEAYEHLFLGRDPLAIVNHVKTLETVNFHAGRYWPLEAALWSVLPSVAVAGAAPASMALAQRVDRAYIVGGGFLVAAAGFAGMTRIAVDSPLWGFLLLASVYAVGLVVVTTQSNEMVMSVTPPNRAGAVSALLECTTEFGGALGMAILGSIGTAVYTRQTAETLPADLPTGAADAARETLAGAITAAEHLPAATGEAVLAAARQAFTDGMHAAAIAAAAILTATALFSLIYLRRTPVTPATPDDTSRPEPTTIPS